MKITDVVGLTISVISDWGGIVINPQCIRFGSTVSWTKEPRFMTYPVLTSDVLNLIEDRQFTFQVTEGDVVTGIIQLHYSYDRPGRNITSASLGFYSTKPLIATRTKPGSSMAVSDDIAESNIISSANIEEDPVSWMRIDYAPLDRSDVIHHECHMHLSGLPDTRLMVRGLPNPKQFVELVMASFYPEVYRLHRLDPKQDRRVLADFTPYASINGICVPQNEAPIYKHVAHFCIPYLPI